MRQIAPSVVLTIWKCSRAKQVCVVKNAEVHYNRNTKILGKR
jgi:hypothetical protein